jgi:paraquat-inducible protein B
MAKKTNPTLIGAFVIGAIALVTVGILAFGGGQYFAPKVKCVVYFPGASLSGLDVGAPVTIRGVKVEEVTSIVIKYDVTRQSFECRSDSTSTPLSSNLLAVSTTLPRTSLRS